MPHGIAFTIKILSSGSAKVATLALLGYLISYIFIRVRGYEVNGILYFIIFLFPVSILYFDVGFHLFYHRIVIILYLFLFLIKMAISREKLKNISNTTTCCAFLFLFASLIGLGVSESYPLFFRFWFAFLSGVLLYVFILDFINNMSQLEGVILSCIMSGFIWAGVGLVLFIKGNHNITGVNINQIYRLSSLNGDANFFSAILLGWFQLTFFWVIKRENKERIFGIIALLTIGLAIIFTYSRGGYIALFVIIIMNLFLLAKYYSRVFKVANTGATILLLCMAILIMAALFIKYNTLGERVASIRTDKYLGSGRVHIWMDTLKVVSKNPFGVGLGNARAYTMKHRSEYKTAGSATHNAFLQVLCEAGFIAFLIYLVFLGSVIIRIRAVKTMLNANLSFWFVGIFVGFIGLLGSQMFISNVYNENIFIQIALLLAICKLNKEEAISIRQPETES